MHSRIKIKTTGGVTGTEQTNEINLTEASYQQLLKQSGCFLQEQRLQDLHQASQVTGPMDGLIRIVDLWIQDKHQQFQIKDSALRDEELDFLDEILSQSTLLNR